MLKQIYFTFFLLIPLVAQARSTLEEAVVGETSSVSSASSSIEGLRGPSPFASPQLFQQNEDLVNMSQNQLSAWDSQQPNQAETLASLSAKIEQMQRDLSVLKEMLEQAHEINT